MFGKTSVRTGAVRWRSAAALLLSVTAFGLIGSACNDGDGSNNGAPTPTAGATGEPTAGGPTATQEQVTVIDVSLTEDPFSVTISQNTIPAGALKVNVTNVGAVQHNFRLIKTDLEEGALPLAGSVVDEEAIEVRISSDTVTNGENLDPGESFGIDTDLEAGSFVIICNVADHYAAGMHAALTVQ